MGHHQLDSLDEQILKLIADNARIPFLEVARACNVSGAAIHQRIQKLTNLGILKGSEYVIDPEKIGYETCAYIGLYLKDPEQFDSVTEALKRFRKSWNVTSLPGSMICLSRYMPRTIIICLALSMINFSRLAWLVRRPLFLSTKRLKDKCLF